MYRDLVERDRNRAAVVFWSPGNETPGSEARDRFIACLNSFVKELDSTRLTTAALLFGRKSIEPLFQNYFGPALNQYFGCYYTGFAAQMMQVPSLKARQTMLDHIPRVRFQTGLQKPLIISEFGAGAKAGKHPD